MADLQVNYEQLELGSRQIRIIAERLIKVYRLVRAKTDDLRNGGWESEESVAFYQKMYDEFLPRLDRLVDSLEQCSVLLQQICDILKEAEDAATRVVQEIGNAINQLTSMAINTINTIIDSLPQPLTDDQRARLEELGVVIEEGEFITTEQAQTVIDFLTSNPDLIAEGMSFADTLESVQIIEYLDEFGLNVEESPINPTAWTVEQLRIAREQIEQRAEVAGQAFVDLYGEEALARLAISMDLPPSRANEAALRLILAGERNLYLDTGVSTPRGDSVAYTLSRNQEGEFKLDAMVIHICIRLTPLNLAEGTQ